MTEVQVALLRGVNVGGKNKLPMKDLALMFGEAGCSEVRTYIQSGNVIFRADTAVAEILPGSISARIAKRFALRVPVVVRTAAQMAEIVANNPFLAAGASEETLHVLFLADLPDASNVAALDPDRLPPDEFRVRGREVYLRLPNGAGNTKLSAVYFDAKLATTGTQRNWRTVTTLLTMMGR